jgi:hypothetical protein
MGRENSSGALPPGSSKGMRKMGNEAGRLSARDPDLQGL